MPLRREKKYKQLRESMCLQFRGSDRESDGSSDLHDVIIDVHVMYIFIYYERLGKVTILWS